MLFSLLIDWTWREHIYILNWSVFQDWWGSCKWCYYACMNTCHKHAVSLHSTRKCCMCYHKQWVTDYIIFILHGGFDRDCCILSANNSWEGCGMQTKHYNNSGIFDNTLCQSYKHMHMKQNTKAEWEHIARASKQHIQACVLNNMQENIII